MIRHSFYNNFGLWSTLIKTLPISVKRTLADDKLAAFWVVGHARRLRSADIFWKIHVAISCNFVWKKERTYTFAELLAAGYFLCHFVTWLRAVFNFPWHLFGKLCLCFDSNLLGVANATTKVRLKIKIKKPSSDKVFLERKRKRFWVKCEPLKTVFLRVVSNCLYWKEPCEILWLWVVLLIGEIMENTE